MANYYAAARTNYVLIKDMEGLKKALDPFPVGLYTKASDTPNLVCILCEDSDGGGWPSAAYVGDDEVEVEFDFAVQVCPFMEAGQVLVAMEAGHEKLRYVTGYAYAYHSDGRMTGLALHDIYDKAAQEFGVPLHTITEATY